MNTYDTDNTYATDTQNNHASMSDYTKLPFALSTDSRQQKL